MIQKEEAKDEGYKAGLEAVPPTTSPGVQPGSAGCPGISHGTVMLMPKTKKNPVVGVRVKWSMYNDTTWMRSNRFGAVALMITGVLIVMTSVFVKENVALLCMIALLFIICTFATPQIGIFKDPLTGRYGI